MSVREEIVKLSPYAKVPTQGSSLAAARDLYSVKKVVMPPRQREIIPTGIAIAWDNPHYFLRILPRSGLAAKHGIDTRAGVIDIDYRKEIFVILQNDSDEVYSIEVGDRIAQCAYMKITSPIKSIVRDVQDGFSLEIESDRSGGFGSTGK